MSETITGMNLYAKNAKGKKVERFEVKWIGQLAFGVVNENRTDRDFLELHSRENDNLTKQRDDLLATLQDIVNYDEARRKTASQDPGIMPKSVVCKIAEAAIAKVQPSSQSVSS